MSRRALPWSIQANPRLDQWIDLSRAGVARVFSAKVELGQGIVTALAQIAAEELGLAPAQIEIVSGDTKYCPNESYTAGSMSIEIGGTAVRMACAQAREATVEAAARRLGVEASRIITDGGRMLLDGAETGLDYWQVARDVDWSVAVSGSAEFAHPGAQFIGKSVPRINFAPKLFGSAFIHDLELPGMLHARVLRPPAGASHLTSLDESAVQRLPGVVRIVRNGDFVAICCEREYQAEKAIEALRAGARWTEPDPAPAPTDWPAWLARRRSVDSESETGRPPTSGADRLVRHSAAYSKPPLAHASIGPSCAIARFADDGLCVWTHSQGVFPLRGGLAGALGIEETRIRVIHAQGAGAYGHNGGDDVALDAALVAREVAPRAVRVQWTREDELAWSPVGSPMAVKIDAAMTADGRIADWRTEIWSGPHGQRPFSRGVVNMLAASHLETPIPFGEAYETLQGFFAGGARNSEPTYNMPHRKLVLHSLPGLPFRTSALRTLGGYANVFATESFMDELAEIAACDPIEFRLRHLSDPRARSVIEAVAELSHWQPGAERGAGKASGIGFCRYKNTAAYVAVVARVEVDRDVRVGQVWCAVDAGLAINPDGVINQVEGGIVQSISWTLKEEVRFDGRRIATRAWSDYPILRFGEAPEIAVTLIERPDCPPLGVGEAAQGPAAAAVANAVTRALGFRVRDLPITRERIIAASPSLT